MIFSLSVLADYRFIPLSQTCIRNYTSIVTSDKHVFLLFVKMIANTIIAENQPNRKDSVYEKR